MVRPEHRAELLSRSRRFCGTRDCPVLYYGSDLSWVGTEACRVRVGIKVTNDPVPLCYCFGFSRADIMRELRSTGATTIPERIAGEIRAGRCACEVKNPSGRCCLGEVRDTVERLAGPGKP